MLDDRVVKEVANWVAAKQSLKVAQNLLRDDPDNAALQTRLEQATHTAEDAGRALKSVMRSGGCTPERLQQELKRLKN